MVFGLSPKSKEKRITDKTPEKWNLDEVGYWLESIGLGPYVNSFRSSKVNGESLNTLTKDQLQNVLQITSRVHLKSFLTAREILFGRKNISSPVAKWGISKVASWLEHWELSSLCQIFKQNAIHGGMLWEISTSDLVYMGVANALHMLKVKVLIEYAKQGKLKRTASNDIVHWNTQKVGMFLDSLGLSAYKDYFVAGSIDGLMLKYLAQDATTDDMRVKVLKLIGVVNELHLLSFLTGLSILKEGRRQKGKVKDVPSWTADRVGQWLAAHDFADKKNVFQTNGIHGAMLQELTLEDLEEHLGMKDPIERERLYRDIQTLVGRRTQYEEVVKRTRPEMDAEPDEREDEVEELSPGLVDELYDFSKYRSQNTAFRNEKDKPAAYDSRNPQHNTSSQSLCIVCKTQEADCQFEDCGHICACEECATEADSCPYCQLLKVKGSGRRKSLRAIPMEC